MARRPAFRPTPDQRANAEALLRETARTVRAVRAELRALERAADRADAAPDARAAVEAKRRDLEVRVELLARLKRGLRDAPSTETRNR